ncbi:hypothetical protein [Pelagibacterium sp.]|uniref:hypothetical protein n=1 Tax=Pelagibacterium sp. TaxID=1967288 RepID=UPI003BABDA70
MFNKTIFAAAVLALALPVTAVQAQDAMAGDAMAGDAMAGDGMASDSMASDSMASDSMAMESMASMMSDDDLALCIEQARAITFAQVAATAEEACHMVHNGENMDADPMAGDAMAPQQ